jgi:microcin C transport system substrate-binding protein
MISWRYSARHYPDINMKIAWRSEFIDSTYNSAGVQDEVIDALIDGIEAHQEDDEALLHYGRAFDRVATWNHYVIPEWHLSKFRVAYWDKLSRPEIRPKYSLGFYTWWIDPEKEAQLPDRNTK